MLEVANRLNLEVERAKTVPCCLDIQETCPVPPPYMWQYHETHSQEVRNGQKWLHDVVCTEGLTVVAVTGQSWLRAVWAEEEVKITNSKADYIFVDATAAQRLPKPPAQPSEAQLLELLTDMQAIYEAKTSKHVQEKGILSLWSQMFAEFLAVSWMLEHEAGVKKSLPVFGGDFNHHMIMHQPSHDVLHFMKHDPDNAGKQKAVACMKHLLKQNKMVPLQTGASDDMDVEPVQHEEGNSADVAATRRGGPLCDLGNEHVRTAPPS